jgi:hypothetical protein
MTPLPCRAVSPLWMAVVRGVAFTDLPYESFHGPLCTRTLLFLEEEVDGSQQEKSQQGKSDDGAHDDKGIVFHAVLTTTAGEMPAEHPAWNHTRL